MLTHFCHIDVTGGYLWSGLLWHIQRMQEGFFHCVFSADLKSVWSLMSWFLCVMFTLIKISNSYQNLHQRVDAEASALCDLMIRQAAPYILINLWMFNKLEQRHNDQPELVWCEPHSSLTLSQVGNRCLSVYLPHSRLWFMSLCLWASENLWESLQVMALVCSVVQPGRSTVIKSWHVELVWWMTERSAGRWEPAPAFVYLWL